jgi:fatty-acyl-CoA synthase
MSDASGDGGSGGGTVAPRDALAALRHGSLVLAIGLVVLVPALLLAGPGLYRIGVLPLETARWGLASVAFWTAVAALAMSALVIGVHVIRAPKRGVIIGILTGTAALAALGNIYSFQALHEALPPIHDIQTDWSRPVAFSLTALETREAAGADPLRDDAMVDSTVEPWVGRTVAAAQAEAYEVRPLLVNVSPADAVVACEEAAKRLGWLVMRSDPPSGMLEAVHYSTWYGLASDIAVRVTPQGEGARIDVRSVSRTPGSDDGANAKRIKTLLDDVAFALRGKGEESRE